MYLRLPQNTPNASPPQHKPRKRLSQHSAAEPDILPRAVPDHRLSSPTSSWRLNDPPPIQPLNNAATRPWEKHAGALAPRAIDDQAVEQARHEDRAGEVEEEACGRLQGQDARGEAEEEGGQAVEVGERLLVGVR